MQRKFTFAILLALILVLGISVTAMAQGNGPGPGPQDDECPRAADGVCTLNAPQDGTGRQIGRQEQGRAGQRQYGAQSQANKGQIGQSNGPRYLDEDGDQLCDHYAMGRGRQDAAMHGRNGAKQQADHGMRHGQGSRGNR
jgi:hypothetical protein